MPFLLIAGVDRVNGARTVFFAHLLRCSAHAAVRELEGIGRTGSIYFGRPQTPRF